MSDYLWDKTGEKDAEVERLEELLGELRYRPRELELPQAAVSRRPRSGSNYLRGAALAAAAAVALAALAGVLVRTRQSGNDGAPTVAANDPRGAVAPDREAPPVISSPELGLDNSPGRLSEAVAPQVAEAPIGTGARRTRVRRSVRSAAASSEKGRGEHAANEGADGGEVAALPESQRAEAKEQLLYALRLASSELGDVRRKIQGADEGKDGVR